jgi:uncharacterized protein YbjQ (UPF0145 family)
MNTMRLLFGGALPRCPAAHGKTPYIRRYAMIMTTTSTLQDKTVTDYRGIVTGEAILGANIFKDLFAGIRDIVGGRSGAYEKELAKARAIAMQEMQERAEAIGANAIIGIDLDYETVTVGSGGGMLMVTASGTAVSVR